MYRYVLFDLDGTLTDPGVGIMNSVEYALRALGINVEDRTELRRFIGPPLQDSFAEFYGMSNEMALAAIEKYREYFRSRGIYENEVYPGVKEMLYALKSSGRRLLLATSKPEEFANIILKHFGLDGYFDFAAGATMDGSRRKKADVIEYGLRMCGITELSQTVMVGDRAQDVTGARLAGIDSIGVLYGYGGINELRAAGATYIAKSVDKIAELA